VPSLRKSAYLDANFSAGAKLTSDWDRKSSQISNVCRLASTLYKAGVETELL